MTLEASVHAPPTAPGLPHQRSDPRRDILGRGLEWLG